MRLHFRSISGIGFNQRSPYAICEMSLQTSHFASGTFQNNGKKTPLFLSGGYYHFNDGFWE
jgi:hypothetical protein